MAQGGADGVNRGAVGIEGAHDRCHLLHQGGTLGWIEILQANHQRMPLVEHLHRRIAEVGSALISFQRQADLGDGCLDFGGPHRLALTALALTLELDLGAAGEIQPRFEG